MDAEALLLRVLTVYPNDIRTLHALATIAYRLDRQQLAQERIRQILQLDPRFAPALNWMTLLLLEQGKASEAQAFASRSIAIDPKNEESYSLLGRTLLAQNAYADALIQFDRGLAIRAGDASLHYGRATALEKLHRLSDAEISWRTAVRLSPEPDGLLKVAELDRGLRRVDDALKGCRRALSRAPDHVAAHRLTARILTEEGRFEEAQPHWQRAAELEPDSIELHVTKAYALLTAGRFDLAIAEFRVAIDRSPDKWEPYYGIIAAKRVTEDERPLIDQMQRIVDDPASSVDDRLNLHYSLGKAHDNLGEYQAAMGHFDEANRLKLHETQRVPPFDGEALCRETDDKIGTFASVDRQSICEHANQSYRPIFVVGMMRSGTTLVEQVLSCHPEIGGGGEQPFWRDWEPQVADWNARKLHLDRMRALADQFCVHLEALVPGRRHVVDKNPANCMIAGLLHLAYPNARIIHTLRHPVDTALSIWMTRMQTAAPFVCDRDHIVCAYRQYQRLADLWRSVIPPNRYLEVRYEDLVLNRESTTRQMVEFCGLAWDEACLHPENNLRAVKTPSYWQVRQPVYTTSLDRWRHYEPWLGAFGDLLP